MVEVLLVILAVVYFARRARGHGPAKDPLASLLSGAETAGIITAAQRDQLLAYASQHAPPASAARLGGAAWLGVFAGLFVVAGVSLLIARNWQEFGPMLRVGAFLATLLVVGEAAIRMRERSYGVSVPLELLWFFLPLLGIGLYAQTFQLTGDPMQPFLVWLALTAALAWLSPRPVVAAVHTFAMTAVLFAGNFVVDAASAILGNGRLAPRSMLVIPEGGATPLAWGLSFALLAAIAVQSLRLLPRSHRHHFIGVAAAWVFCLLVAPTPFHVAHPAWIILAALALVTIGMVATTWLDTSVEERAPGMTMWLGIIYALTFTWHMRDPASGAASGTGVAIIEIAFVAAIVATLLLPNQRLSPQPAWALGMKAALVVPLVLATLYLGDDMYLVWLAAVGMNLVLLVVAVGAMWHGSLVHEPAQVNLGVLVLVALLITRFLDVFGSMLQSGIGFIVAGLLLAALSWALERMRRRLLAGVREVPA